MLFVEMDAEEMRANRTMIDALIDVANCIVDTFRMPVSDEDELNSEDEEDGE